MTTIYQSNVQNYSNYMIRFLTINIGHIIIVIFSFLLFSLAKATIGFILCTPFFLYAFLRSYYPSTKNLITKITFDSGVIYLEYLHFSKIKSREIKLSEANVSLLLPHGAITGTPFGRPVLVISFHGLTIRQFSVKNFIKVWDPSDIREVYKVLKSLKQESPTNKEMKIIKRLGWEGDLDQLQAKFADI